MSIKKYLEKRDWRVLENSSQEWSYPGLQHFVASETFKRGWSGIYPPTVTSANHDAWIYVHDLGALCPYCGGWNLEDLLENGYGGVKGKIESFPAKRFSTALGHIWNMFYTISGEMAGAQAYSNFDTLLAPYIYNQNLEYEEVEQLMQEFIFNLNVSTRVGMQTPFTNLTFDLTVPKEYANQYPSIAGKPVQKRDGTGSIQYKDLQNEMNMINIAFCKIMTKGDRNGTIFSFPIPTYNITKEFDWDNVPQEIWEMTAKYGVPYFANYVNSDMNPEDARSMCCRLRLSIKEVRARGGIFASNPLTGSIGVVTINLPKIFHSVREIVHTQAGKKELFALIRKYVGIASESLEVKRSFLEEQTMKGLYPYAKYLLRDVFQKNGNYWGSHFSTIGMIGMHEALITAGFDGGLENEKNIPFAASVMEYMKELCEDLTEVTGNLYNLEATPAEGASYSLAQKGKKEGIFTSGESEPFYTNSVHFPVDTSKGIFEVLDGQAILQESFTGGTVVHVFLGEAVNDWKTVKAFVKKVVENYKIPYFTLTPTFSICKNHGHLKGKVPICPSCGEENSVYSRIVGYFRPIVNWNAGKKEEFKLRKVYTGLDK